MLQKYLQSPQDERPIVNVNIFTLTQSGIIGVQIFLILMLAIPILIAWNAFTSDAPIDWGIIVLILGLSFFIIDLVFYLGLMSQQYLITSPVGIEYVIQGYNVRASWDQLTKAGKLPSKGTIVQQGVLANRTIVEMTRSYKVMAELAPWMRLLTALMGRPISESPNPIDMLEAGIPVNVFDPEWASGRTQLGAIMRRYAPQVFGAPRPQGPTPEPDTFPPMLYPLVRPQHNRWYGQLIGGVIVLQVAILVAVPWVWSGDWLWNPNLQQRILTDSPDIEAIAFAPDNKLLLISKYRAENMSFVQLPAGTVEPIRTGLLWTNISALSPNQQVLVVGTNQKSVAIWKKSDSTVVQTLTLTLNQEIAPDVSSLAIAPDNDTVAIGMENGTLRLWSIRDGKQRQTLIENGDIALQSSGYSADRRGITNLIFTLDGRSLVSIDSDGKVQLWSLPSGAPTTVIENASLVTSIAVAPNSQLLAIGLDDDSIELYRLPDGQQVHVPIGNHKSVGALAFSPDGMRLATGDGYGVIRMWRTSDGALLRTMSGHRNSVTAMAFTADGRILASTGEDATICLWDVSQS